jgi:hypothetical protein
VAKLCDRYEQEAEFADFFITGLRDHRGTPQACVLWGEKGEGHESFVERLVETRLRTLAARAWPGEDAKVEDHDVPWPKSGTAGEMQRRLPRMLVDYFDPAYMDRDLSARALSGLLTQRGAKLVVLHHEIEVSRWTAATAQLLQWYLDVYWSGLPPGVARPEILVIVKLVYVGVDDADGRDPATRKAARQRLRSQLAGICEERSDKARRILLPELAPVEASHVRQWLERHCDVDESSRAKALANELFLASGGRVLANRSMEELQDDLRKLLEQLGIASG